MQAIRGAGTKPEILLRKGLHALGFRYRLQVRDLPGRPDLVLAKHRAVVFAHGCFWHGHGCALFRWPATREAFWRAKIQGNMARDARDQAALEAQGWRVALVWECALKGRGRQPEGAPLAELAAWITSGGQRLEIMAQAATISPALTAADSPSSNSTV